MRFKVSYVSKAELQPVNVNFMEVQGLRAQQQEEIPVYNVSGGGGDFVCDLLAYWLIHSSGSLSHDCVVRLFCLIRSPI